MTQKITFTKYVRVVLPLDGYLFWVRADVASPSALLNAAQFNAAYFNEQPHTITPAPTFEIEGALHFGTARQQTEDESYSVNQVIFNANEPVQDLNMVGPAYLLIAEYEGIRFAFSQRQLWFEAANIQHYVGNAVYADMASQIVDDPAQFDRSLVVSNSLPIWLSMNDYRPPTWQSFSNASWPLYPSFLSPFNIVPPYATVHIDPTATKALGGAPVLARDLSHSQLCTDRVRVTLWGTRNADALSFVDFVNQFSLDGDTLGIMNIPVVRDEKRTQAELGTIAMKKAIEFEVSYQQYQAREIGRRLIKQATVAYYIE